MVENLKVTDLHDYSEFIKSSKKLNRILDSVPEGSTKLEKAYYVYLELGKILSEDPDFVLNSNFEKNRYYEAPIDERFFGICKTMSELYGAMLKDPRIGIDSDLVKKVPNAARGHVDLVFHVDGKHYITNLIDDISNIKIGKKTASFGFSQYDRLDHVQDVVIDDLVRECGLPEEDKSSFKELLSPVEIDMNRITEYTDMNMFMMQEYETNENYQKMVSFLMARKVPFMKAANILEGYFIRKQYVKNLDDEYGMISNVSEEQIKQMDEKFGYAYKGLYTDDVYEMLAKDFNDPETVKRYVFHGEDVPENEQIYYKLDYVFEHLKDINLNLGEQNYLELITNLNRAARAFLTPGEQQRITSYAVRTGNGKEDISPVLKVKGTEKSMPNRYYTYSQDDKTFHEKSRLELQEFFESVPQEHLKIVGTYRNYDMMLNYMARTQIEEEMDK